MSYTLPPRCPDELLCTPALHPAEKLFWLAVRSVQGGGGEAWADLSEYARRVGQSKPQASRTIKRLLEKGWLERTAKRGGRGLRCVVPALEIVADVVTEVAETVTLDDADGVAETVTEVADVVTEVAETVTPSESVQESVQESDGEAPPPAPNVASDADAPSRAERLRREAEEVRAEAEHIAAEAARTKAEAARIAAEKAKAKAEAKPKTKATPHPAVGMVQRLWHRNLNPVQAEAVAERFPEPTPKPERGTPEAAAFSAALREWEATLQEAGRRGWFGRNIERLLEYHDERLAGTKRPPASRQDSRPAAAPGRTASERAGHVSLASTEDEFLRAAHILADGFGGDGRAGVA
ncbi:MAG: helix-turn-helix domain-containing protein [Rhodothermales bacterium]|nr:helix-turn-helix domain-containing protein [Rhodothermales bacterium]